MLCLNKEALKDKYVILDGTTPLWDEKNNEPLYNADEPALLVRNGELVLYYGQALRAEPMDGCLDDNYYFFEDCLRVESVRYFCKRGTNAMTESFSCFGEYGNENFSSTFMAPVHYVTDPEVYQAVSLDPFAGTDKSHPYPYHILVKHNEFDADHADEHYLDGMSAFIGFSLEAPEDKQVCLVREYEGRYTPKFVSAAEFFEEFSCELGAEFAMVHGIPEDEKCPSFDLDSNPGAITMSDDGMWEILPEGFYADEMDLDAMEVEFICVFINTHLGKMYHISETEYQDMKRAGDTGVYGYSKIKKGHRTDPNLYWYGRRCLHDTRYCTPKENDIPDTLVEGIHFIIDSDDDPAYENGQHSVLWEMFDREKRMMLSDDQAQ